MLVINLWRHELLSSALPENLLSLTRQMDSDAADLETCPAPVLCDEKGLTTAEVKFILGELDRTHT